VLIPKFQVNARYYGVHIYLETRAFLASPQVQAPQFPVYISHFLINCKKKANLRKWICPYWKTISHDFVGDDICGILE